MAVIAVLPWVWVWVFEKTRPSSRVTSSSCVLPHLSGSQHRLRCSSCLLLGWRDLEAFLCSQPRHPMSKSSYNPNNPFRSRCMACSMGVSYRSRLHASDM